MCLNIRYENNIADNDFNKPHTAGSGDSSCTRTSSISVNPVEQARKLARNEAQLFESLLREVERIASAPPPTNQFLLVTDLVSRRPDEEIMYNCSQLSRLAASLVISFHLSGLELELDIFELRNMALCATFGDAPTLLKQFLAWPLSALQNTGECPKQVPGWCYEYLFGVKFRRLIRGRILNPSDHNRSQSLILGECMLRCKRSAYEVSEAMILSAMRDHGKDIGEPDGPVAQCDEFERVKKWIKIVVDGIVPTTDEIRRLPDVLPTGTACFEKSRSKGGCAIGALTSEPIHEAMAKGKLAQMSYDVRVLHSMHWSPRGGLKVLYCRSSDYVVDDFFITKSHPSYRRMANEILMRDINKKDGDEVESDDPEGAAYIKASAVAVLEPLKVRMITKGESVPYLEAKRLQTRLTNWMKCGTLSRFFPALHGWISPDVLDKRFNKYLSNASGPQDALSGDYKGATDTLRRDVSAFVIDEITSRIPEYADSADAELMKLCLIGHKLEYSFKGQTEWRNGGLSRECYANGGGSKDNKKDTLKWSVDQKKGQLMGSFLSFPVLNIVNAAVHFAFFEHAGLITDKKRSYMDAPFLVNGDDVLALGPKGCFDEDGLSEGRLSWEEYVGIVGFKKSLGKNYISNKFCTVNSTLFEFRDSLPDNGPRRGFKIVACPRTERLYNTQWYACGANGGNGHDAVFMTNHKVGPGMVGGLVRELLLTVEKSRHELAVRLFIELNKEQLKAVRLPWFVPEDLGGLGIPCLPEMSDEWKNDAKTVAYFCRMWNTKEDLIKVPNVSTKDCNRPCDLVRSQFDMDYLKTKGYRPTLVVDPTPEEMEKHALAPKSQLDPLCLIAEGIIPGEFDDVAFARKLLLQSQQINTVIGKAAKSDLSPSQLHKHSYRVLWLPYGYTRDSVPLLISSSPAPEEPENLKTDTQNPLLSNDETRQSPIDKKLLDLCADFQRPGFCWSDMPSLTEEEEEAFYNYLGTLLY